MMKWQKKYVVFFLVVPIVIATSVIEVGCPHCSGTGTIHSLPTMEKVELLEYDFYEIQVSREVCGVFIVYRYGVSLSALNRGDELASGFLRMLLVDSLTERILDEIHVPVSIPSETILDTTYDAWFASGIDIPGRTRVEVEVVLGEITDIVCNGSGKVPLNTVLLIQSLEDTITRVITVEHAYRPPIPIDWEAYHDMFLDE